ncbi:MAG: endonuclease [Muribaculaceae bacterium]|nr:endonuclease [Muribaculaceae bacterium]
MKKFFTLLMAAACSAIGLYGADRVIPNGYYNSINGLSGAELKTAVYKVIYPHTEVSYSGLPTNFEKTDVYPNSKRWWDMYSDIPLYAPSFKGLNREHSFPKSWWGGQTDIPAYVDLNHLYPSESAANMAKSNYPLGTVDRSKTPKFDNGISTVGIPVTGQGGGATLVFEPDDEYKGDFARTYFYMATCYQNLTWKYTYMVMNSTYPTLNTWSRDLLLQWARADQVSQKEIDRNEAVYRIQNNRNPFIDFPELAEYIWGDKTGEPFILSEHIDGGYTPSGTPTLITPVQDMELDFGEVAIGHSASAKLHLKGENLKEGQMLTLTIYDRPGVTDDATQFTMGGESTTKVAPLAVNSADGLWVNVDYKPTELGLHETRMVISGGGISGSIGIGLRGECLPQPELTAPVALAATDITDTSYTANWEPGDQSEVVDYYIVNRTIYGSTGATTEQIVAEETSLEITDFSGSESYTVQAVRLGIVSAPSNSVIVSTGSITGVYEGVKLSARNIGGAILINTTERLETVKIIEPSGKTVIVLEGVEDNTVVPISNGLYLLTTPSAPGAIKVIVKSN